MGIKIVLLNGPPGAGKDEIAKYLLKKFPERVRLYKMTTPMDDALKAFFNFSDEEYALWREQKKDAPFKFLPKFTKSFRDVLISFSEKWAKLLFGKEIFGILARSRIEHLANNSMRDIIIVSDCGFKEEVVAMTPPDATVHLVKVLREGHDFTNDSRSYLDAAGVNSKWKFTVHNDGSLEELQQVSEGLLKAIDLSIDFVA